jgi:2-alkenal reductase
VIEPPAGGIDYESAVLRNIYEQVNPSVVNVTVWIDHPPITTDDATPEGQEGIMPFVNGSGFVWDGNGHIVTNNHVVESAERIQVNFFDGTAAIAEVVGTDVDSDLAVLKIDPAGYILVPVQRGNIDDIYVGMRVAAIGNPFGLQGTLTSGIISAIGRSIPARGNFSIPDSIQTDTAINPGNSGGPLLNERGEVIGVNAQIRSDSGSNSGVGFAIPIAIVERVVPELIKNGTYDHSYMGITGTTFSPTCSAEQGLPKELRGVMVGQVLGGSPADKAGLQGADRKVETEFYPVCPREAGGDVITAIEGQPVTTFDTMLDYLMRYTSPGDTISLTVLQDGDVKELDLVLGARPRR